MKLTKKLLLSLSVGAGVLSFAQDLSQIRPVLTGAPFLRISPDARAGGLGDQGVATTSDGFSQFWNAAKYPFSKTTAAAGVRHVVGSGWPVGLSTS